MGKEFTKGLLGSGVPAMPARPRPKPMATIRIMAKSWDHHRPGSLTIFHFQGKEGLIGSKFLGETRVAIAGEVPEI
jgi:hypothetical protein